MAAINHAAKYYCNWSRRWMNLASLILVMDSKCTLPAADCV